ncbi:MAG: tetratricopeptide repeat protein [Anaerolineae bacterium]|nr:tetratricopeptide repeat protein [Anaerolineae bacterium]
MARLSLSLLGSFQATLDGAPISGFEANKVRALLAYLAVEAHQHSGEHPRQALATLLWPDKPERAALANLRNALANLRSALGDREAMPPYLQITRETIQFNRASDHWLDVAAFRTLIETTPAETATVETAGAERPTHQRLLEAVALYRGDFMAGFFVRDSPQFEDWVLLLREKLHWQALDALDALTAYHEQQGAYGEAIACARRQVTLEPWQERAHRRWMRALALSGHRGAALAQYEVCRQVLADELGVEPEAETATLCEQIRTGTLAPPAKPPPIAVSAAEEAPSPSPPSLGQGVPEGERRIVTVVQAEVSGSTALTSRVDAEDWAAFVGQFLRAAGAEVHRLGGEVDRYDQQGLVALFGAGAAHEDDPERAVLFALAMQAVFRSQLMQFAQSAEDETGWNAPGDPGLRVSVHTGEAIVTPVEGDGGRRGRHAVMGDTLSSAGRTLARVPPGEVRVSEATHRLVAPLFEWGSGERSRCPLGHKAPLNKGRGIEGLASPLVGRDTEFRALQEAVARLRKGIGGIVTVVGEAGIGKSRLVAECRGGVTPPVRWVEGRCLSYATGVAYSLWVDTLRSLVGLPADASPTDATHALWEQVHAYCSDRAGEVCPFLARMMALPLTGSAEDRLRGLDAEELQVLTSRAVEALVECTAQQKALVLACEDLHWADPTSLALLEQLLPLTDRVPLLLICVHRPEKDHGCWRIKETAERLYGHRHTGLWLDPLTDQESAALVGHLLRIEELSGRLRAHILGHAEGNPFYVEEILRSLIDGGIIAYDEATGRWSATRDVDDIPIPATLHGVLLARIDRLPQGARQLLQLASVIGRIFERRVLESISQRASDLDENLVVLQRAQMIRTHSRPAAAFPADYIFKHQLTQEAAYESLLRRKRRVLHRRVAEALEQLYPERVREQPGLMAHHWERAGEVQRAIPYLRRAGERAAEQYANAEAAAYLSRALDLVPQDAARPTSEWIAERYALLSTLERVHKLQRDRYAQGRDLATLEQWAEDLCDKPKQTELAVRRALYSTGIGELEQAITAAWTAVRLAQVTQDVGHEAMAYRELGRALHRQGKHETAQPHLERALDLARAAGLRQIEADILHILGELMYSLGHAKRGIDCYERALRICRELGDRRGEGEALQAVGWALLFHVSWNEGERYVLRSLDVSRTTGNLGDEAVALLCLGMISYHRGHHARARSRLEHSLRICHECRDQYYEAEALYNLGLLHADLTDYVSATSHLEESLRLFHDLSLDVADGWALVALGFVLHLQGDYASAGSYYERALQVGKKIDDWQVRAKALMYMGLLYHHMGDDCTAREYAQRALCVIPSLDLGWAVDLQYVFAVLGHALAGLGHLAEAAENYRQCLTMRREREQHHLAVEPLAGLARVALAQGDPAGAMAHVGEILDHMKDHPALAGTLEPLRIYLTCYRVLLANEDPRASEILDAAYHLLQERAARIEDDNLRYSYLENVAVHREIIALWERDIAPVK